MVAKFIRRGISVTIISAIDTVVIGFLTALAWIAYSKDNSKKDLILSF